MTAWFPSASSSWNQNNDWIPLARFLDMDRRWDRRKTFLAHAAILNQISHIVPFAGELIPTVESFANDTLDYWSYRSVLSGLCPDVSFDDRLRDYLACLTRVGETAERFCSTVHFMLGMLVSSQSLPDELGRANRINTLLRELFTYETVPFLAEWRRQTVLDLAHAIDESKQFALMPILGDALEEAGCDSAMILQHCRQTGVPHVRGCWLLDLILGRD